MLPHLKRYLGAVLRKWWADIGVVLTLIGYLTLVAVGIPASPWFGVVVALGVLAVAQYSVYRDLDRTLPEVPPTLATWALHAASANANGTWFTIVLWGDPAAIGWSSEFSERIADLFANACQVPSGAVDFEPYANFVRVKTPSGDSLADKQVEVGSDPPTLVWHSRLDADVIPLKWVMDQIVTGLHVSLSDAIHQVIRQDARRLAVFGLSNWPLGGVTAEELRNARQVSRQRRTAGGRVVTHPGGIATAPELTNVLMDFLGQVLQDAGYLGFEPELRAIIADTIERLPVPRQARDAAQAVGRPS